MQKTIELDAPPGAARPGDLIMQVVKGTCLEPLTDKDNPKSMFMGNWTWEYPTVSDEDYKEAQQYTKPRIERLYHAGFIRYGSW